MGSFDVTVKEYTRSLFIPVVLIGLLFYKGKPLLRYLHQIGYAYFLSSFVAKYNKKMGKRKQKLFTELHDMKLRSKTQPFRILEVGAGAGANFKFYPEGSHLVCIDPNPYFDSYLKKNLSEFPHVVLDQFIVCGAENMSTVASESMDAVVCTLVMCTVNDMDSTMAEIKRVLKKDGKFFYLEHVAADEGSFLNKVQHFIHPVWKVIGDNCHLIRNTGHYIQRAGFSEVQQEHFRAPLKLPLIAPHLAGIATK